VKRDGDVVLDLGTGQRQPDMTPALPAAFIAKTAQAPNEAPLR
jgi:hypothetical protein